MKDVITYIPDLIAFKAEAVKLSKAGDDLFTFNDDNLSYNVNKIPVRYKGNESICLIRGDVTDLERLGTVQALGECIDTPLGKKYEFIDAISKDIYERVRGSIECTYEVDGKEVKSYRPYMIGVFS